MRGTHVGEGLIVPPWKLRRHDPGRALAEAGHGLQEAGQPLRIGIDIVDVGAQRRAEGGRIQPDRQSTDHQDAPIDLIQAGQLGLTGSASSGEAGTACADCAPDGI